MIEIGCECGRPVQLPSFPLTVTCECGRTYKCSVAVGRRDPIVDVKQPVTPFTVAKAIGTAVSTMWGSLWNFH